MGTGNYFHVGKADRGITLTCDLDVIRQVETDGILTSSRWKIFVMSCGTDVSSYVSCGIAVFFY